MQRPRSVSTLALVLALLSLSSLGVLAAPPWDRPLPLSPELLRTDPQTASRLISGAATINAVAAMLCALSLWKMRLWAPLAYLAFAASMLVYVAVFAYLLRAPGPLAVAVAAAGLLVAGLYWGWRLVRRVFAPLIETL